MNLLKRVEVWNKRLWYKLFGVLFRNKAATLPLSSENIRRVLVFRYDRIGDAVVSFPMIELLTTTYKCEVDVLCSSNNYKVYDDADFIAQRIVLGTSALSFIKTIRTLSKRNYDVILCTVFHRTTAAGLLANFISRSAIKVGRDDVRYSELYMKLFSVLIRIDTSCEAMHDVLVQFVRRVFLAPHRPRDYPYHIALSESRKREAELLCRELGIDEFVIVNISAGESSRTLDAPVYHQLLTHLVGYLPNLNVVVLSVRQDSDVAQSIARDFLGVKVVSSINHILDVAAFVSRARLVVTPDTSITHLADACGIPVVSCHTYANPDWYPSRVPHRVVLSARPRDNSSFEAEKIIDSFDSLWREISTSARPQS